VVEKITGIIEGANLFITDAPVDPQIKIPDGKTLKNKLKYSIKENKAFIQVTGQLTAVEKTDYETLCALPDWGVSLLKVEKQQTKLFKDVLSDVIEAERKKSAERKAEVDAAAEILK